MASNTEIPTKIGNGRRTVTSHGTAVQLHLDKPCKSVVVMAETDNTDTVTVGNIDVIGALLTRIGVPLEAGDSLTLNINNLNDIYIDSIVNGEGITYLYEV